MVKMGEWDLNLNQLGVMSLADEQMAQDHRNQDLVMQETIQVNQDISRKKIGLANSRINFKNGV